jgi:hypothetical protein
MQITTLVGEVIPTKVTLSFSQLQNFMAQMAVDRQLTFYLWGHADVAVLPSNSTYRLSEEVWG